MKHQGQWGPLATEASGGGAAPLGTAQLERLEVEPVPGLVSQRLEGGAKRPGGGLRMDAS